MFAQLRKTRDGEGGKKETEQRPRRNVDHSTCNDCGEKSSYSRNSGWPTQSKIKMDAEVFRKMKQEKYSNKPPGGGYHNALVNVKDALCSLMMGSPTEKWGELPSPGLVFWQTSTQDILKTEHINNNLRKDNSRMMHVGDTILDAAEEARID